MEKTELASGLVNVIGSSTAGEKLIIFGGLWGTLGFFSHWLELPKEIIITLVAFGGVIMLVGFAGAFYGRKMMEAKEIRLDEIAAGKKTELSRGDMAMLAALQSAGNLREHEVYTLSFPYDDERTEEEIRGTSKMLRVKYLVEGGHVTLERGEYAALSGDQTVMPGG